MRYLRICIALTIAIVVGVCCTRYQIAFQRGGGDVTYAVDLGGDLLRGVNPYSRDLSIRPVSYPMTAGIVAAPLLLFAPAIAAGLFLGASTFLLALGCKHWWQFGLFLSFPFWEAVITVQWAPLLLAIFFLPHLLPLTLCKPQLGLPIILTHLTKRRAIACAVFFGASLLFVPSWPLQWLLHQSSEPQYAGQYLPPIASLPFGPLVLLGLFQWCNPRVRYLLLLTCMPQRLWYDLLMVFAVPQSRRQMFLLMMLSWLVPIAPLSGMQAAIVLLYLPALMMIAQGHCVPRLAWFVQGVKR